MTKRILIIGGVAGGATAAARARRLDENASILLIERGSDVSFANCGLPYYIGGEIKQRESLLVQTKEGLAERFKLDVRIHTEALRIDRKSQTVFLKDLESGREYSEPYDQLILSPGAVPIVPPIKGVNHPAIFTLRDLHDMDGIQSKVNGKVKQALIIGGGFIGLELAENLMHRGVEVTVVDLASQVMSPFDVEMAKLLQEELESNGVSLYLENTVAEFEDSNGKVRAKLKGGQNLESDLVILAIGVRPESKLARECGLNIAKNGAIIVDEQMKTNDPNIYAVGDAVQVRHAVLGTPTNIPLAGPANRQGRLAADNMFGKNGGYRGSLGTSIVRVFGLVAAQTGVSEKVLIQAKVPYRKIFVTRPQHVTYYPGSKPMTIKLLFADDGRILGSQIVGRDGVDKRIDVLATAIFAKLTVDDLAHLELAYSPQYGAAKDPVNIAGYVAGNCLRGEEIFVAPDELGGLKVLDVRETVEFNHGHAVGAIHIPLGELRNRLHELDKGETVAVMCAVGQRAYYATRILKQNGFKALNVMGGYQLYRLYQKNNALPKIKSTVDRQSACCDSDSFEQMDLRGMQCPGPLAALAKKAKESKEGAALKVLSSDSGFGADLEAWCSQNGHQVIKLEKKGGDLIADVRLHSQSKETSLETSRTNSKTFVVFSGDLDRVLAAFILANAAADMGDKVTLFFTFWGLNALRRNEKVKVSKGAISRMFGLMMPKGPERLKLSKMNMAGLGTAMMKKIMNDKGVDSLPTLMENARHKGVRLIACSMSLEVMGLKPEELLPGVEVAGAATFLAQASKSNATLFL
ncbi:MAG: FAD-dependent oxidoreductase [Deltaproteobacteria bacterium]|nr:FAD-dependent oxidoreductase [Deltaproteobacteria bacterium]